MCICNLHAQNFVEKRKTVVETRKSMAPNGGLAAVIKAVQEQVAQQEAAGRFKVGDKVLGCFPEDGAWYEATVLAKNVSSFSVYL